MRRSLNHAIYESRSLKLNKLFGCLDHLGLALCVRIHIINLNFEIMDLLLLLGFLNLHLIASVCDLLE